MSTLELKVILSELERRGSQAPIDLDLIQDKNFPEQNAFVLDPAREVAAFCTRRAGKSNGLALRFKRTMLTHPGCFCPYTALTRESAKNIMWDILREQDERFKIGATFTESNLTMTMRNGSRLQLFGADMKNFIARLRGIKTPGCAIDEAQDFGPHIEKLVDDVFGPAILDYTDGWLAITGTPGPVPAGFFFDITAKGRYGYSIHTWSLFNNPYLPNPEKFVRDLQARKAWADDNPTLLREYYGRWVLDLDALVIKYQPHVSGYATLPEAPAWSYIIGVDLGSNAEGCDKDAIAVIGWNPKLKEAFLVEELTEIDEGITALALVLEKLIKRYNPDKVVMDTGGLGKKIAAEMRMRFALPIVAAEKADKYAHIELLNDALRTGRFKARADSKFAQDAQVLKWDYQKSTSERMVISDAFHSDIIDAVLYAFRESLHWLHEPATQAPAPGADAWFAQQEAQAIQALEQGLAKDNNDPWAGGMPWD